MKADTEKSTSTSSSGRKGEQSFTLIETVIALGLMVTIILEISKVQGNAIYFSSYERQVTQAVWVAKGVMSKVEYWWNHMPFEEMDISPSERKYDGIEGDYSYTVEIAEWKLPIMDLLSGGALGGGGGGGEDTGGGGGAPGGDFIRSQIQQIIGDEILKIARVEVFWPDGAKKDSVGLTLLLANQKKLDQIISTLKPPSSGKGGKGDKGKGKGKKDVKGSKGTTGRTSGAPAPGGSGTSSGK